MASFTRRWRQGFAPRLLYILRFAHFKAVQQKRCTALYFQRVYPVIAYPASLRGGFAFQSMGVGWHTPPGQQPPTTKLATTIRATMNIVIRFIVFLLFRNVLRVSEAISAVTRLEGIASAHHNLGLLAEARGADDEALMWYRRSLALAEELGNRAGMPAHTSKSVCCLRHEVSRTSLSLGLCAVGWSMWSQGSPEIHLDLYWLTQQRQMLGEARFLDILREQLSEDDASASYVCSTTLLPVYRAIH